MKITGLLTALITPFKNNVVDEDAFKKHLQKQLEAKVNGVLILGTTAETATLSIDEQLTIIKLTSKACKNKAAILVGTGTNSTAETIKKTKQVKELGADAALVVTPYYNKPTQLGLYHHFAKVAEETNFPLVIYNIPSRTGVNLEVNTLIKLASLPNIIGIKECSQNFQQISQIIQQVEIVNPNFKLFAGDDALTLPLMALGAEGIISVVSNLIPEKIQELVQAIKNQDLIKARYLHYKLLPLFEAAFLETNPIPIKKALALCQAISSECRLPLTAMTQETSAALEKVLKSLDLMNR